MARPCHRPCRIITSNTVARALVKPLSLQGLSTPSSSVRAATQTADHLDGLPAPPRVPVRPAKREPPSADGCKARSVCNHKSSCISKRLAAGKSGCRFKCSSHRTKHSAHSRVMRKPVPSRAAATTRFLLLQKVSRASPSAYCTRTIS